MKTKKLLLLTLLAISIHSTAQIYSGSGGVSQIQPNSPTSNTNVGIGTNTPSEKLHVKNGNLKVEGKTNTNQLFIGGLSNGQVFANGADQMTKSTVLSAGPILADGYGTLRFHDFPQSNLMATPWTYFAIEDRNNKARFNYDANTGGAGRFQMRNNLEEVIFLFQESGNTATLTLPKADSYLGIGTSNFVDGSDVYRLSVKGKVRAEEIKVYNTWADYVFADNYVLTPLNEVEKFIKENNRLQNFPSAKEIEEKGLPLGEITKIQQEKIEELTLYLIQQNKEIENLKKRFEELQNNK